MQLVLERTWLLRCCFSTMLLFHASSVFSQTAREVASNTFPSVVLIVGEHPTRRTVSLGSGFFVESDIIATNYHVIKASSVLFVRIVGKKRIYEVSSIVAADANKDLALLRVKGATAPPLALAESSDVGVGDDVYAIGNPEGLEGTFSQGVVSGIRRLVGKSYFQITAPISHGSSGGPVLNKRGEVIGIASGTMRLGQNLNFAISVSELKSLLAGTVGIEHGDAVRRSNRSLGRGGGGWIEPKLREKYQRNARANPKSADAHYELAELYRLNWSYPEALAEYKLAYTLNPALAEAYFGTGEVYSRQRGSGSKGELYVYAQLATEAFKKAISIRPFYAEAHLGLGKAYFWLGHARAIESSGKPNVKDEDIAIMRRDATSDAIDAIKQAIRIKPEYGDAYLELGKIYFMCAGGPLLQPESPAAVECLKAAIESLKKAISLKPNHHEGYEYLGQAYELEERYDDAILTYVAGVEAVSKDPAPISFDFESHAPILVDNPKPLLKNLYLVYSATARVSEGIRTFKRLDQLRPKDVETLYRLGQLHVENGDKTSALKVYQNLKEIDPISADILFNQIYK